MICVLNYVLTVMSSAEAYLKLRREIPESVRLIAVSKKQNSAAIEEVYAAGCHDFAENYLQEGLAKIKHCALF